MNNRMARFRSMKWMAIIATGIAFQATACNLDARTVAAQWATAVANEFITSYTFDVFNVSQPFSF